MNSSCFICTRQLSPKGFNTYATWCGHVYHRQCIAPFVDEKKHCPYCKRYCSVAQLIKLQWKLIDDDDEITIMAENKISNELMMENVAMLTRQMNDKDSRMSKFEEQLEGVTEKLSFITLENRELKRKNYQLKIKFSNMKREIERNKPNQDSIIEELYQEIMVLTLLVREVKVTGK